jgi:ribonuclease P protein component
VINNPSQISDTYRGLKRKDILRGRRSIKSCLANKPLYTRYLICHYHETKVTKAAFFVPKRTGKAVERNLAKRRMRELYRLSRDRIPAGAIIFRLRENVGWEELRKNFAYALVKLGERRV